MRRGGKAFMPTKRGTRASTTKRSESEQEPLEDLLPALPGQHKEVLILPLLPIRNTVLMPNVVTPLFVGREQSMKAIENAMSKNRTMFVVTQLDEDLDDPGPDDVYT